MTAPVTIASGIMAAPANILPLHAVRAPTPNSRLGSRIATHRSTLLDRVALQEGFAHVE